MGSSPHQQQSQKTVEQGRWYEPLHAQRLTQDNPVK
jgi:hypothetical protein